MQLHEIAYHGKADTESQRAARVSDISLLEEIEHVRQKLGRNPDP
jgi:hypothetical protein